MSVRTKRSIAPCIERRDVHAPARSRPPTASTSAADSRADPTADRHRRGGRVLFEIPFRSAMSDSDLARLARLLDLTTHMHPKMRPDPTSPGVARLDRCTGLYLERGESDGQWVLHARTWGRPAPESVRQWEVLAAWAARQLEPKGPVRERSDSTARR